MNNVTVEMDLVSYDGLEDVEPWCLRWEVLNHSPALFWMKRFKKILESEWPYYARFTGFPGIYKDYNFLAQRLNHAIDVINREGLYTISERPPREFTQEYSNIIHHHFEVLFGSIQKRSDIYVKSSGYGKQAIQDLNHFIHDMESLEREIERESFCPNEAFSAIITEVGFDLPRVIMPDEFFNFFTLDTEFGDMVAHYGLVGKTWWEVFLDDDEEIFEEAIRPLNVLTGEFDVFFGQYSIDQSLKDKFMKFLEGRGKNPNDKKLALGYLPIAKFLREKNLSNQEYKKEIARRAVVEELRLVLDGKTLARRNFKDYRVIHSGFGHQGKLQVVDETLSLEIEKVPIQCLPVKSESGRSVIKKINIHGWSNPLEHRLCLVGIGPKEKAIVLESKKVEPLIFLQQDQVELCENWQLELDWIESEKCYTQTGLRQLKFF